jgi:deoxycytidylate deaminase
MSSLALLVVIGLLVWFWLESLKSRDIATQVARNSCRQQELQLLDGTVSLQTLRPYYRNLDDYGLKRTYTFDYSGDGLSRQTGCVVLYNSRVVSIVLEA